MATLQVVGIAVPAAVGLAVLTWQVISWRRTGPKVKAELAVGQLNSDGLLSVEFPSGKSTMMTVPNADGKRIPIQKKKSRKKRERMSTQVFCPVNVIFVYNRGRTAVSLSRCEYVGHLTREVGFHFEPQPGVSPFGDQLPKMLDSGQGAILIHDYKMMKAFLNEVMWDHDVNSATFNAVLTLGNGSEVFATPGFRIHTTAGPDVTDLEYEITRDESPEPHFVLPRQWSFPGRR